MKRVVFLLLASTALITLTACNTVRGIGQDVEQGGKAIQKAVK